LAESQLSLNPPEAPVTAAATPTAGMDSTQVNIQRYPAEIPTAHEPEQNPIPAASDSLSEAERRLLGHDQAQVTTQELQVAAPHEQLGSLDTTSLNPTVVQPQLATKPLLQREAAIPEALEAVEPLRESSVSQPEPRVQIPEVAEEASAIANANPSVMRSADLSNVQSPEPLLPREISIPEAPEALESSRELSVSEPESRVQIPEVAEEPPAIANTNPSVMRSADLSNVPPPQTSPVAPLPSLPADHLSGIEPIVSSQAELSPVHAIEPADTEQNTQDVPSVPVQRQEDETSPPPLVESLPLPSQALPDASQPPPSFVQTQATADSPPPLNPPSAESPPAIAPVLASDNVNVQPSVQPDSDRESVAITETSDLPQSTEGASPTAGESLQESGITPTEPSVVEAFAETDSSALSQTSAAPLESPVLTEPERHQSSIIGEPVADSSTPLATPELETITPSSTPTLEEALQPTETPRVDTDTAPSPSEILQPRLETEPSAPSEAVLAPASEAAIHPEPLVSPASSVTEVSESPGEATSVAESEAILAQPLSEPESSESSEGVSSQDNKPPTSSIPTTPEELPIQRQPLPQIQETVLDAIAPTHQEASAHSDITSPTTPQESAVHRQPLPQTEETVLDAIAPTQQEAGAHPDITSPTSPQESAIHRQPLPQTEETVLDAIAPTQQEAIAHSDITSPTSPQESAVHRQPLPQTEETVLDAIAPTQQEASDHSDITSPTSPEESSIQRQLLPETEEMASDTIAPTQQEASTPADITSPTTPQESSIQRQLLPEIEETAPDAIAPTQQEASTSADITSPTTPQESAVYRQPLPEIEETAPEAIAPTQQEASAHPDITSPTTPQESAIQRQPLPEIQETAPDAITPTQQEAIAHPDIISPTSSDESSIQRQPLPEIEETPPDAIAPTQEAASTPADITSPTTPQESAIQRQSPEEVSDHPDITSPTSSEESAIQRQMLPETAPVPTESTPSATETELPSTISQSITTDSTLVMPKTLPDDATLVSYPTQPEPLQPTEIAPLDENTSLTEPIIAQPLLESDANGQSERLPTATNSEAAQENSPQISPASVNSSTLPSHLVQTKTNGTEDESFNPSQDIPQLPTVLENLVETRPTLPLIQPLNQQSSLLSTALTSEFSTEQPTLVQSMPETSNRLFVASKTPLALPEDAFSQALQSTVKVSPVSLDTEPLTLQRAADAIPKTTPESNQEPQQIGNSTYTSEIPNSWFSIADLLENTTTHSSSGFGGENLLQMAFNDAKYQQNYDGQESNDWDNLISQDSRHSDASSTFIQEHFIQKFTTEEPQIQDEASAAEHPTQQQDDQHEDGQNLEILAREIYSLVRQRLAIERERYGHY
jgi:hypothetical protein